MLVDHIGCEELTATGSVDALKSISRSRIRPTPQPNRTGGTAGTTLG